MVELMGRSLLEWQVSSLRKAGIESITIVCGYRGEMLAGVWHDVVNNPRWADTNMVASLMCGADILKGNDVIVSYSDIAYHPSLVERLIDVSGDISMVYDVAWKSLWTGRFTDPLEDAETFKQKNGQLLDIGAKAKNIDKIEGQFIGLLKFTPQGWLLIEKLLAGLQPGVCDSLDMTGLLKRLLVSGEAISVVPVDGQWVEVDSDSDLSFYMDKLKEVNNGVSWRHDWRW